MQETIINIRAQNTPPQFTSGPSDNNSNSLYPTQSPDYVTFTATAVDVNNDLYSLRVCEINATNPITCNGQTICASSFVASGTSTSCSVATNGKSGNYTWYAFVCDDYASNCSAANQGIGINASPYYVNNNPTLTSISASPSRVKLNSPITVTTIGAVDSENDLLRFLSNDRHESCSTA